MAAYYNELDPRAAASIRARIAAGLIAPGEVDERSIADVRPDDLRGFDQCHFFAGGGAWSYALRLAGWPDDQPVWTGSCPCQPFSAAGKRKGFSDDRHLWPAWFALIRQCGPVVVLGEQVGGSGGRVWVDLVHDDMEANGYAVGAIDTPACSVGAPHIRQRLYWVAHTLQPGRAEGRPWLGYGQATGSGGIDGLADADSERQQGQRIQLLAGKQGSAVFEVAGRSEVGRMVNTASERPNRRRANAAGQPSEVPGSGHAFTHAGPTNGHWRDADWLFCRDGKWRPVEPGTFPLADGVPGRVGRLREHGNAIVAPQAAAFVRIVKEWGA